MRRARRHVWRRLHTHQHVEWSIGVFAGDSPYRLAPACAKRQNPVLTRRDVADTDAFFVADPFVIRAGALYYMYFEVMEKRTKRGSIGLARSLDGYSWDYVGIVLREPFHLSYPYVFQDEGIHYMLPESHEKGYVCLYEAASFPMCWLPRANLLDGRYVDPSILHTSSGWWLFVGEVGNAVLRLFHATRLEGPYREHPCSPIVNGDRHRARPAGRVITWKGRTFRSTQDCSPHYGLATDVYEITDLSTHGYEERRIDRVLEGSGAGWNSLGMHHMDGMEIAPGRWIAWVDGSRKRWSVTRNRY